MKIKNFILLLLVLILFAFEFNRSSIYKTLNNGSLADLEKLEREISKENYPAHLGALKIKKANFLNNVKDKLESFKEGKFLLEESIQKKPKNVEYRFLRLMLQENLPPILNYSSDINDDKALIISMYTGLNTELKDIILGYAKTSSVLKTEDLK